ncbi:hypothetical protein DCM91_16305 [Chitinophaga costaii]|nr:hypothetical protein DCM91_16305 [Chitinophaga costaii]
MVSPAQGFFSQKKTQTKYLLQQIAELKVYLELLKKGYSIAQKGLKTINDIKQGDFHLHDDYFTSLKTVNPQVKRMAVVANIILYQQQLMTLCKQHRAQLGRFLPGDNRAQRFYLERVESDVSISVDLLSDLVTNGKLALKDDGRIGALTDMEQQLAELYRFTQRYARESVQLMKQRQTAMGSVSLMKQLNGLP